MTTTARSLPPQRAHRARRFPLHLPVLYCRAGEGRWQTGFTENISESGAIIRSDAAGDAPGARVMVAIALPSSGSVPGGWLIGEGTIVRIADASVATPGPTFAVAATFALARPEDVADLLPA